MLHYAANGYYLKQAGIINSCGRFKSRRPVATNRTGGRGVVLNRKKHPYITKLIGMLEHGRIDRREFLRVGTFLGLSATAAYGIVAKVLGPTAAPARAESTPTKGGVLKVSMRIPELKSPHTYSWSYDSNNARQVNEYLTRTGADNVTRPWLLESWEPSDDLVTWTLRLRRGVTWNNGERFVADHVVWNLKRMLDPAVGSSFLGLMDGFLLTREGGETRLWDASAIEAVDDYTVRLNGRSPQLAVPENLFHYPALMLWPESEGVWGEGAIGTGPFTVETVEVGRRVVLKARRGYWGIGPYLDELHFIDHGDDPSAEAAALNSRQVQGQYEASITQYEVLRRVSHLQMHNIVSAQTAVARMKVNVEPFDDPRVRKAMRLALDTRDLLQIAHLNIGAPGEHHHVALVHPEYVRIGAMGNDPKSARALLAEAGYPNGFETEITCRQDPAWEPVAAQAMAEMWKKIGIQVRVNVVPSSQYWEVWTQVPFGLTAWTHRPLGTMVLALAYRSGVPWNESDYANPIFDSLLNEAEGALDIDARRTIMAQLEEIMLEDGPICLPLWRGMFSFWDNSIKGFHQHPTSYIFGEEIYFQ
jgi:peptide/nickel transport system substrate-binding protein